MGLLLSAAFFVAGLFIIIKGGDILVRSALRLNECTGINQVIIGATFVSVATTLPEVFVSMFAVLAGNHGIAAGNAIGAMIANIALVFAISLLFFPSGIRRGEVLFKALFLFIITGVVFIFTANLEISWLEGTILIAVFIMFLVFSVIETKTEKKAQPKTAITPTPPNDTNPAQRDAKQMGAGVTPAAPPTSKRAPARPWLGITLGFIVGQAMLCVGAFALVENGETLANAFGLSETVLGFTIIAVGTSLPELVTTISSIRRRSGALAIGNVIGANIINCTMLLGVCGVIGNIRGTGLPVSRETAFIAVPMLCLMTIVAVLPVLIKGRAFRIQGVILLALYIIYITYLLVVQPL